MILLDSNNIVGLIIVKVKNLVIIMDNNGVNVKLIDEGSFLWKYFFNIDKRYMEVNIGIIW